MHTTQATLPLSPLPATFTYTLCHRERNNSSVAAYCLHSMSLKLWRTLKVTRDSRLTATWSQTGVPKAIALSSCFILLVRPIGEPARCNVTNIHDVTLTSRLEAERQLLWKPAFQLLDIFLGLLATFITYFFYLLWYSSLIVHYRKMLVPEEPRVRRMRVVQCKVQSRSRAYLLQAPPSHILPHRHLTTR